MNLRRGYITHLLYLGVPTTSHHEGGLYAYSRKETGSKESSSKARGKENRR